MAFLSVYSGSDVNLSVANPGLGIVPILSDGIASLGINKITVRMGVENSRTKVGMDGAVALSVAPGYPGEIEVEIFQTSTLQGLFLNLWNLQVSNQQLGDVSSWFGSQVLINSTTNGSSHNATGAALKKFADKTYAEEVGMVNWVFVCGNITHQGG